jgi:CubicO group peptidase (beta-lactamase class C family)
MAIGHGAMPASYVNAGTLALGNAVEADENTLWRIYSMTKPITAACAMILIEQGRIGLDQPVGEVLPALKDMKVATDWKTGLEGAPAKNPITMRHLLTHTAGFTYNIIPTGKLSAAYAERGITPALNGAGLKQPGFGPQAQGLADMVERLSKLPLMAEPGTAWNYSVSLDVIGAVIEKVSGMGLDAFMKTRLFDPLGMRSTGFRVDPKDFHRYATNYLVTPNGIVPIDAPPGGFADAPAMLSGGGGLVSSTRDYTRFGQMLLGRGQLGGVRVMKNETAGLMMSNLLPPGLLAMGGTSGYGAGGRVVLPGQKSPSAPGSYGWGGAAGTLFSVDPARNALMVFMTQFMPESAYPTAVEIPAAIAKDLAARG